MKIGRNDPCPCGSGKKYKHCCLLKESMSTGDLIRAAVQNAGYKEDIANVLCNLSEYMKRKQWWGACHASCSALYVALSELGYSPKLCIGEMLGQGLYFDHSWIELDGQILDIAISMTLLGGAPVSEPIVFGKNIRSGKEPVIKYGVPGRGIEGETLVVNASMFLDNPALETTAGTLKDIADITMGQSPSGSSYNEDGNGEVFYQGRAEFGYRFPTRRLFTTEPKRMAEAGDVLLSVRAPVGDLNVAYERCCIGRGLGAIHGRNGYQSFVLYVIGQEFEGVCMMLDYNWYYEGGHLKGREHPNPDYLFEQLLYQGLTRVRSKLALIVCSDSVLAHILPLLKNT